MNLSTFLASNIKNSWIELKHLRVYLRKSNRYLDKNTTTPCLDIASISVDENKQGQGIFTKFLDKFENIAKKLDRIVFIESILNDRLLKFLIEKRGYTLRKNSTPPSVYKTFH
jgi:hypothetical protein